MKQFLFLVLLILLDKKCIYLLNTSTNEGLSRMDRQIIDQIEISVLFVDFNTFSPFTGSILPGEFIF